MQFVKMEIGLQQRQSNNNSYLFLNHTKLIQIKRAKQNQHQDSQSQHQSTKSYQIRKKMPNEMKNFLKQRKYSTNKKSTHNHQIQINSSQYLTQMKVLNYKENLNITQEQLIQKQLLQKQKQNIKQLKNNEIVIKSSNRERQSQNEQLQKTEQYIQRQCYCSICQGQIQKQMFNSNIFPCIHKFCKDCTRNYIIYKIKTFEQVYCPNQNCQKILNAETNFFNTQFTIKERRQYLKIHDFYYIHQTASDKMRLCPKQDCDGVIKIKLQSASQKCQKCNIQFCSKCFSQNHEGQCQQFQISFLKSNLELIQCKKCKNYFQKTQGCSHITCKCGYQFCQKCDQEWKKGHICKLVGLNKKYKDSDGCDWGLTQRDHLCFLIKIPPKFFLVFINTILWLILSFITFPVNIFVFLYWLYLILIKPTIQLIQNQGSILKILIYLIAFPITIIVNLPRGINILIQRIDGFIPQLTNSYRWIISI